MPSFVDPATNNKSQRVKSKKNRNQRRDRATSIDSIGSISTMSTLPSHVEAEILKSDDDETVSEMEFQPSQVEQPTNSESSKKNESEPANDSNRKIKNNKAT